MPQKIHIQKVITPTERNRGERLLNISFVLWGTGRTGGTHVLFEVANRLSDYGNEVTIVSLGGVNHNWFHFHGKVKFIYPEVGNFPTLKIRGVRYSLAEVFGFLFNRYSRTFHIDRIETLSRSIPEDSDVIFATNCFTAFSTYRSKARAKAIFYYIQHYEPLFFSDSYNYMKARETYYLPLRWIVNSTWANNTLEREIGRKGQVIIPGVDSSIFYPRKVDKPGNEKVIVALGKSNPIKGLNYLFEALKKVKEKIGEVKLVLYGNEPFLKYKSPVKTEYVVRPTDSELAIIYSSGDVIVTPSLYESSPLPPLEAMACGCPVVTTQYGVEDYCFDGVNAAVVLPEDPNSLSDAIIRVLSDQEFRNKLIRNGLSTAHNLTWDSTARRVENIVKSLDLDILPKF